ncbi:hypothetical protein BDDG_12784, partial [Blastomyces dermatitidis ATCC 18188]
SSHVTRSAFINNSELNVKSLIKNLENVIMKKLSVLYITESSVFSLTSSVTSFSATSLSVSFSATSQSSTLVSVSGSPALTTSVPVTLTFTTSGFTVSAFITSSPCFKKMLYRLNELYLSRIIYLLNSIEIINICVFRNRNTDITLFYTHKHETYISFTSMSEIILIEDDNIIKTILFYSQASSVTFSSFSAEKIVHISDYKHSVLNDSHH